jgi:2-polyprenyl-3-methyl-5-hydroxy-6-metoxy-1,4-benzoquinol methylase
MNTSVETVPDCSYDFITDMDLLLHIADPALHSTHVNQVDSHQGVANTATVAVAGEVNNILVVPAAVGTSSRLAQAIYSYVQKGSERTGKAKQQKRTSQQS